MKRVNISAAKITLIIGLVLSVLAASLLYTRTAESNDGQSLSIVLGLLAIVLIILGNFLVTTFLDKFIPWKDYKIKRFFCQVVLGLAVSLLFINGLYFGLKHLYTDSPPDMDQLILINSYSASIIIPTISIYFGIKFLRAWNASELEAEQLQKENARSQMMSLRNHLDPHFLFNNLNILSSLIDHDVSLSKTYLEKFAEVYRTILKSELSDLISLRKEMELIDAYTYLIKIRWRDALDINIDINEEDLNKAIPPLSGQMLIENVIKHNTISRSNPMEISIKSSTGNYLEITNTIKPKKYNDEKKSGTGLLNIKNRYAYFTDRKVEIENESGYFKVLLPLLEIEE